MVKRELSNVKGTCLWVHDGEFISFFGGAFTGSVNNYKCLEHMDV